MNNWRDDPVTPAQKRAIKNMCSGWGIEKRRVKNKGEACDEIGRLIQQIADIKARSYQSQGYGFQPYSFYGDMQIDMDLGLCGQS